MIIELRPFNLACIADEASFEEASAKYVETYLETSSGWICHKRLDANRYIRYAVKGPALSAGPAAKIKVEQKFLPDGKVPYILLEQIVQFYRDVIGKIGASSSLEARADIVWNAETGYRVAIPTQTVSGAHLDYSNDHLRPGDIIVVDTHSHGSSMGAFFSSTDDKDDTNTVRYSGVIGKISSNSFDSIWRFNKGPGVEKDKVDMAQIFDRVAVKTEYPEEWLAKVEKPTQSAFLGYQGRSGGTSYQYGKGGFAGIGAQRPAGAFSPHVANAKAGSRHISAADWYRNLDQTPGASAVGTGKAGGKEKDLLEYTDEEIMERCGLNSAPVGGTASEKKSLFEIDLEGFSLLDGIDPTVVDVDDTRAEQREMELFNSICDQINDLHDDQSLLKVIREAYDCLSPKSQESLQHSGL